MIHCVVCVGFRDIQCGMSCTVICVYTYICYVVYCRVRHVYMYIYIHVNTYLYTSCHILCIVSNVMS